MLLAVATVLAAGITSPTRGATITWTGGGATMNWNLPANWSPAVVPVAGDVAVFDATSALPALMNVNVNVAGIDVTAGYLGTITQGAGRSVNVDATGWSQAGGVFVGSAAAITVNGPWSQAGGAYTNTSGTLSVSGSLTQTGGTFAHNFGTLRLTGAAAAIDLPGSMAVWNLTLAQGNLVAKTLALGDALVVQGLLTLTNGTWDGGELQARGGIAQATGFDGGTGTLRIDGSGDQTFTGSGSASAGALPHVIIDKPSGVLTLASTIRVFNGSWSYVTGALVAGASVVVFDSGSLISGGHELGNVTLRGGGTKTIGVGEALTVNGALTLTDGTWDGGELQARGGIAQATGFDGGTGTLRIDGSGDQTFTGSATNNAGFLPRVMIEKSLGILTLAGTIRTAHEWTHVAGTLAAGTSTLILRGPAVLTMAGEALHRLDVRGGTAALGSDVMLTGDLRIVSGQLDTGGNAVDVAGSVTVTGTLSADGSELRVDGDVIVTGSIFGQPDRLILGGTVPQSVDFDGFAVRGLRLDNAAGAMLAGDISVTGTLDLEAGTLAIGPHRLTIAEPIAGSAGTLQGGVASALTVGGIGTGIGLPASVTDLGELEITNPAGVALSGPLTVHGALVLDGGNLVADPFDVTIAPGGFVSRTSGHVIGRLAKPIPAGGALSVTFEIGDSLGYAPALIDWPAVGTAGSLAASTSAGDHPGLAAAGLDAGASVNRTWSFTATGLAAEPNVVTLSYLPSDLDPAAEPLSLLGLVSSGGTTTLPPVIARTATSASLSLPAAPAGTFALANRVAAVPPPAPPLPTPIPAPSATPALTSTPSATLTPSLTVPSGDLPDTANTILPFPTAATGTFPWLAIASLAVLAAIRLRQERGRR